MEHSFSYIPIFVGVLGLILHGVVLAIGGTWKLAQMEKNMSEKISQHRTELDAEIEAAKDHSRLEADGARREFGETIKAIQAKIHEFETWARDTFVRRESFLLVTKEVKDSINTQGDKIDKRLDKIDEKLDRLQER